MLFTPVLELPAFYGIDPRVFSPYARRRFKSESTSRRAHEQKRSTNNVLILQVIVVLPILLAGVWYSTEWTAAHLGFQPRLGKPWLIAFFASRLSAVATLPMVVCV